MHRDMVTIGVDETYVGAARLLREHGISAVIVTGQSGPAGIVTDRDYVDLVADGQDPASVRLGDRMSTNLVTVESGADVRQATQLMAEHHIRHLPVVDAGTLVGMMSIRDPVAKHPVWYRFERARRQNLQAFVADRITQFAGSMPFVYVHIVWFAVWITMGVEPFPFGLLTMIVSLEAIFLSTFVMISQNRADDRRKVLADHQWELVQHEEYQNEELLRLSQRILSLTTEVHKLTVATTARQ
jgi:hypothetical protein